MNNMSDELSPDEKELLEIEETISELVPRKKPGRPRLSAKATKTVAKARMSVYAKKAFLSEIRDIAEGLGLSANQLIIMCMKDRLPLIKEHGLSAIAIGRTHSVKDHRCSCKVS